MSGFDAADPKLEKDIDEDHEVDGHDESLIDKETLISEQLAFADLHVNELGKVDVFAMGADDHWAQLALRYSRPCHPYS